MDKLKQAYTDFAPALVRITISTPEGDLATGSGFHVGNGIIVTARHVVDRGELVEMVSEGGSNPIEVESIHFHSDPRIDLAVLQTNLNYEYYLTKVSYLSDERRNAAKTDRIPLGEHLDDWIGNEFVLSRVLVMGYPRIPLWADSGLVAASGEVNAVVDRYDVPHPHFVISYIPRGGFSGGPVISEWGFLLGIVTNSLIAGDQPSELGFGVAVSVEPLLQLFADIGLRPPDISDTVWDLFTTTK